MTQKGLSGIEIPKSEHLTVARRTIIGTATIRRAPLEPQRLSDHVLLEWWSPSKEPKGHVAISYAAMRKQHIDWPKGMKGIMERHPRQYVVVFGPPAAIRDKKAVEARDAVLNAGANWKNTEPGKEDEARAATQEELHRLQESQAYSFTGDEDLIDR